MSTHASMCPGCGGRVGSDCFNPAECQWIAQEQQRDQYDPREVDAMRSEIHRLRALIRTAPHASHCEAGASLFPGPCNCWKAAV